MNQQNTDIAAALSSFESLIESQVEAQVEARLAKERAELDKRVANSVSAAFADLRPRLQQVQGLVEELLAVVR